MPALFEEPAQEQTTVQRPAFGPWQHTLFLVGVLVLWAIYGMLRSGLTASAMPLTVRYISSIVMQLLLTGSTLAGIYHRRAFLSSVLGRPKLRQLSIDALQGCLIYLAGIAVLVCARLTLKLTPLHGTYRRDVVQGMLPNSHLELALWIVVGIVAGTGEEFIFRGYFQKQFAAWFGNAPLAIGASAILFGCMHFYQGAEGAVSIGLLGALYGVCAWRLGNLRGVMIAHSLEDVTAGLVHYLRHA